MNTAQPMFRNGQNFMNSTQKPMASPIQSKSTSTSNISTKYWGIWLPVPTFLAIVNSIFWTWLILSTVGYSEQPIDKATEKIIEQF